MWNHLGLPNPLHSPLHTFTWRKPKISPPRNPNPYETTTILTLSDSEDGDSTDVSNPYRNIRWTDAPPRTTQTEAEADAEAGEEGPTSAFPDAQTSPRSHALDPVTIIGSRGEAAIYPEPNEDEHQGITLPPYDSMSEYEEEEAQDEEEEDIHIPPNPSNVPTPGYRPVSKPKLVPTGLPKPRTHGARDGKPRRFLARSHPTRGPPTPDPTEPQV